MIMKMNAVERVEDPDQESMNRGVRELLLSLPQADLIAILKTVTGSLVQFGSVPKDENGRPKTDATTHAINSILMYGNAHSLLDRRGMRKAHLAAYLNQKGVKMTMPATKNSLANDVLSHWGQKVPLRVIEDEAPRRNNAVEDRVEAPRPRLEAQNQRPSPSPNQAASASVLTPNSSQAASTGDTVAVPINNQVSNMEYEHPVSLRQREAELGQRLGREFSAWYYERLNSLTDFTVSHFWAECNFRLEIIFAYQPENTLIEEVMCNGEVACAKIKDLVAVKSLRFVPNPDTGIRGYLNPHGLAQVMVCGILYHQDGSSVGVFEQMFGLMKDPRFGNNFKIKFTVLRLREGNLLAVQGTPPELLDSSLVGIVEEIDDDDE